MGKYLKKFETHTEYNAFTQTSDFIKPNVSYCVQENEVHYNPWVDPKLVCKYNVTSISSPTQLRTNYEQNIFKSMEIDGVQLDNLVTEYTFGSTGVHTVKYELYDETKLGNNAPAFFNIASLISVSIPNSVTTIGTAFFQGCSSLTNITIPNSVTTISNGAFNLCSGLTSVTIPDSVTSIGGDAFSNCNRLVTITVDSNNSTYDSRDNCNAIIETATNTLVVGCSNTVIPNSVTSIGDDAFYYCSGLTSVTIPDSVISIGGNAFYGCSSLTSVIISDSVSGIGESAFAGCTSLTSVTIGNGVTSIGRSAFGGCSGINNITSFATTAPTIRNNTFYNVKTNGTLTVPQGSSGYDVWMGTGDYYLGKYGWTKEEQ